MTLSAWTRFLALGLAGLVLQVGVLDQIVVGGTHADALVLLAGAAGVVLGPGQGATVGFVLGLFADAVVELPFGLSALTFVLVAFVAGLAAGATAGRDRPSADAALCVVAAAAGTLLYALLGALLGQPDMLGSHTAIALLVVTLGAVILGFPALAATRWAAGSGRGPASVPSGGSALG